MFRVEGCDAGRLTWIQDYKGLVSHNWQVLGIQGRHLAHERLTMHFGGATSGPKTTGWRPRSRFPLVLMFVGNEGSRALYMYLYIYIYPLIRG